MRLPFSVRKLAAAGLALIAVASSSAFDMDGPQSTILVEGPVARSQLHLFYVTLAVGLFIFIAVGSVLAFAQWKFRARPGDDQEVPPPQTHGHPVVEVSLIAGSILLLVIIAIPTVRGIWYTNDVPDPENAFHVRVTGYQWWFKFEYPDLGIVTANELVIPTNRPVHIDLRTMDVIHSFWVPKLAGKLDLIPNRANHMWLEAEKSDYFWAQCAEYCGESHANMKFRVISLDEPEFSAWVQRQKADARTVPVTAASADSERPRVQFVSAQAETTPAGELTMEDAESPFAYWQMKQVIPGPGEENAELIAEGRDLFGAKTCGGCHTIRGAKASNGMPFLGVRGPDLTHFGSRTTIAAAVLENTDSNLHRWLSNPNAVKPGNIMWREGYVPNHIELSEHEIQALVAFLHSLK